MGSQEAVVRDGYRLTAGAVYRLCAGDIRTLGLGPDCMGPV